MLPEVGRVARSSRKVRAYLIQNNTTWVRVKDCHQNTSSKTFCEERGFVLSVPETTLTHKTL